ncbi:GLIPR1-like protein 1 isoform X2 [Stegastes partitus]|uniref:GLIPR1-like protein 1 isoform X2 n=1 Tax=Stegastes partitus TaxID=144197 RepID=A0A9Y4MVB0_9TELE|nr:PREDICTED: glioma pathogenesis-related protein 1 isoform X2 [Stegastes partitus]
MEMFLWTWIILHSAVCSLSLPDISDEKFIEECVREHNRARSSVSPPASNMLYMTWDEDLAITARAWAKNCVFEHNVDLKEPRRMHPTFPSVGENIWTGSPPSSFDVTGAIQGWVNEKMHYSYGRNTCTKVCGHYTQVVWATSYKVGCAVQLCRNGVSGFTDREGAVFVCNYATAGNMNGRRPYESQGAACSGCDGTCVDNLCRSKERDSDKSDRSPAGDPALTNTDSNYGTILIARPIVLIVTFVTAFAVRYFYPDVFCYE